MYTGSDSSLEDARFVEFPRIPVSLGSGPSVDFSKSLYDSNRARARFKDKPNFNLSCHVSVLRRAADYWTFSARSRYKSTPLLGLLEKGRSRWRQFHLLNFFFHNSFDFFFCEHFLEEFYVLLTLCSPQWFQVYQTYDPCASCIVRFRTWGYYLKNVDAWCTLGLIAFW